MFKVMFKMSLNGLLSVSLVFFILCDISLFVTCHNVLHTRARYQNPFYRHSHYHNQHLYHPRSSKRVRTDLDSLMEKLNVTDGYLPDGDNNLDSLLNLDAFNSNVNETVTTERWKPSTSVWQNFYNKPEEDTQDNEDEDNTDDDDDDDDEDDPEISKDSAATANTQSDSENEYRSPISERKWKTMANRADLDKYFHSYKNGVHIRQHENSMDETEVINHMRRVSKDYSCKIPRPKVVKVTDYYPKPGKIYSPQCTILHQCSEDSGCCSGLQKCGPKETKSVFLYFNTISHVFRGQSRQTYSNVEKLEFYNHTECECADDTDMPRDSAIRPMEPQRLSLPENNCRCPSEYTARHLASGQCTCDCFDKQRDCIKYKKGKEYFNHRDRLCIEMETCLPPSCDFGIYNRRSGRCPRKHEKFRTWSSRFLKN